MFIEISFVYPIGKSAKFRVSNFLLAQLLQGEIQKDGAR
ncbi:hypothetical protein LEP1GSC161_0084 [Leptospira santarosai str. CBC1416]|uniref:Uncharacterized protein n=1 Tax=Leptospira santarosai str. CBC1416 TaxID=1193059 RepID=M6VFN3_9LEPT|nr:hypothetical protein LEP1GSC161_0084 [Leptospira santarosai str. CBC1416]